VAGFIAGPGLYASAVWRLDQARIGVIRSSTSEILQEFRKAMPACEQMVIRFYGVKGQTNEGQTGKEI
jgi:hypothetical protein